MSQSPKDSYSKYSHSIWAKAEIRILREMFTTVEWRKRRKPWQIKPSFLYAVQKEICERLHILRHIRSIGYIIRSEIKYNQELRAYRLVSKRFIPRHVPKTKDSKKPLQDRKAKWRECMKDQLRFQPTHNGTPYASHFHEEQNLLNMFRIPLNEIARNLPKTSYEEVPCPIHCSFRKLMGIACVESSEIYLYALAVSRFIRNKRDITIRHIGEQFVETYPSARPLLAHARVLDVMMIVLCKMLDKDFF